MFNKASQALDGVIGGVARAAVSFEEFPAQQAAPVDPADWAQAGSAVEFWQQCNLRDRAQDLEDLYELAKHNELHAPAQLVSLLLAAPDPSPFLLGASDLQTTCRGLQSEVKRLQRSTKAAEDEASSAIGTVLRVQKLEAELQQAEQRTAAEARKASELQQQLDGLSAAAGSVQHLQSQLQRSQSSVTALQADNERTQSELFALRALVEQESAAGSADADEASQELERARAQVRSLERDCASLQSQLAAANSGLQDEASPSTARLQRKLVEAQQALEDQAGQNAAEVAELQQRLAQAEAASAAQPQEAAEEPRAAGELAALREQVAELASLAFATAKVEGVGLSSVAGEATSAAANTQHLAATLRTLLQGRNQRVAAEAVDLRRQLHQRDETCSRLQAQTSSLQAQVAEQARLVAGLEDDLQLAAQRQGSLAPDPSPGAAPPSPASGQDSKAVTMLGIVTSQRDRFRARMQQLEELQAGLNQGKAAAEAKAATAQADNVKLFEKIKFLESYAQKKGAGVAGAPHTSIMKVDANGLPLAQEAGQRHRYSCGPLQVSLPAAPRPQIAHHMGASLAESSRDSLRVRAQSRQRIGCFAVDEDYEAAGDRSNFVRAYDARLNPFAEFQKNELDARMLRMGSWDRAILSLCRLLVASRIARLCGVAYMLALHAFLALLVYAAIDGQGSWTALELSAAQAGTQESTLAGPITRQR